MNISTNNHQALQKPGPNKPQGPWKPKSQTPAKPAASTNPVATPTPQEVTVAGQNGRPGFRGEDKHSQYGPEFQVVDHGPKLADSSGEEILVGLHDSPPASVNYRPVELSEQDKKIATYIDSQLKAQKALGVDWSKGDPQVKDLAGRMVSPGEALLQAARANDVDPLEMTALLLETQNGSNRYNEHVSPLKNPLFQDSIGGGPQTKGNAGLDYAFGIPRPQWEGFTNQAYLAAGNFRTKAAYGAGDWWKGSRSAGVESHFRSAQAARYIQEHGDGFADGAIAKYRQLQSGFEQQHGSYETQYKAYGPDQRPRYASGGEPIRQVGGASATGGPNPLTGSQSPFGRSGQQIEGLLQMMLMLFLMMPEGPQKQNTGKEIVHRIRGQENKLSPETRALLLSAAPSLPNYKPQQSTLVNNLVG